MDIVTELTLSLLGVVLIALNIPWSAVFSDAIPGGGDNPAHPVLMKTIGDAFFNHFSVVHYSFDFWGGFEAFQFYFPLPYLFGAFLAKFISSHIAFKLVCIFGPLLLPMSFYWLFRQIGTSRTVSTVGSVLSIPFLYTEAHVMWGANIFSNLAGMIGNSWAFAFFPIALGALIRSRRDGRMNWTMVFASLAASFSHFYALLMLVVAYAVFVIQDLFVIVSTRKIPWRRTYVYLAGFIFVGLMSWWLLPLIGYRAKWSAEFGGDWNIDLLKTFTLPEQIAIAGGIGLTLTYWFFNKLKDEVIGFFVIFGGLYTAMFFLNDIFNTSAFLNARIWPTIYFSLYLFISLGIESVKKSFRAPFFAILIPPLWFLTPQIASIGKASHWMRWNFADSTQSRGWGEMNKVLDLLRSEPPSRVSYESADTVNGTMGTVRMPEILPYLTPHEIILGGIVNSAPFSGIGYMHQCLMSNECAGWPNGSIMPEKDLVRSVVFMKKLGIQYHLAFRSENIDFFKKNEEFDTLFSGEFVGLFKLKSLTPMVEVFDRPLPRLCSKRAHIALANLPRWDKMNDTALIFDRECRSNQNALNSRELLSFLIDEWNSPRRTLDRGWKDRAQNRLNTYLFSWQRKFDPEYSFGEGFEFFIADRGFDPDLQIVNNQRGYSELGIPLIRSSSGTGRVVVWGKGYDVYAGDKKVPIGVHTDVEFNNQLAWLVAKPQLKEKHPYIEIGRETDADIRSGLPVGNAIDFPTRVTQNCSTKLEKSFHQLTLHTNCPGQPHLIKYTYYPKWRTDVPVELGSYGFMALTPKSEITVLRHQPGGIDIAGMIVTAISAIISIVLVVFQIRSRSDSRETSLQA